MDLRLFFAVIWRFRVIVMVGSAVAIVGSILTIARIDFSGGVPRLEPRERPVYASSATLLVTEQGFPWGSAVQQYATSARGGSLVPAGDLGRLTSLANLYVQIANSDVIAEAVAAKGRALGAVSASQNYATTPTFQSSALPMLTLTGTGNSAVTAVQTTKAGVVALENYLTRGQRAAGIAEGQRVVLQQIRHPRVATVVNPTKKTLPLIAFLTIMFAVVGLTFVLENVRPRLREAVPLRPEPESVLDPVRRRA